MKKLTHYILPILVACATTLQAQDYHLSHYDAAPLYLNPALTGMSHDMEGDFRASINSRNQWRALGTKPFTTYYAGYDMVLKKGDERFGAGGYIINNRGGIGNFNTFNFMASGAYDIIKSGSPHVLRTGLNMGLMNKSFRFDNYSFDNQYSNTTGDFDQSLAHNENFMSSSLFRFDAAFGVYYKYADDSKIYTPAVGIALHHVTMPKENFSDAEARLPIRWVAHTDCKIITNEKTFVTPKVLFMQQAKAMELNMGFNFGYKINNDFAIVPGFYYRNKDAFVADLGIQFANNMLRFSYDINNSYLSQFTGGRGAFEISLVMVGEKGKPILPAMSFR
ncbi:MAG: PorP/SprF family type IX secretion system membrane protein [Flavobacteriales bacterium]